MRVAVVGGVHSTEVLLRSLVRHGFTDVAVWGYVPSDGTHVSGWSDLARVAAELKTPAHAFRKVATCETGLREYEPDVLFVVGLSQIIPREMLGIARLLNVGFHPTALPEGRGRAAIAWLVLGATRGAATFFELTEGVDDGPILTQEHFTVDADDDARVVEAKVLAAEERALDAWLPKLRSGNFEKRQQDHSKATWLGRRTPEDGWLDWSRSADSVLGVIRAAAPPNPGGYTFRADVRIEILAARLSEQRITGVAGRIVGVSEDGRFDVQCGDAILEITEWRCDTGWKPRVGERLGYYVEVEVFKLQRQVALLTERLEVLERRVIGQHEQD